MPGHAGGESETIIGNWLRAEPSGRERVVLITKVGFAILGALGLVAARYGAIPAEVTLGWIIARPGVTAPIAGATSLDQLASLARAPGLALDPEDLAALAAASA